MSPERLSDNGRAALAYARMGWPVIPTHHPVFLKTGVRCSCSRGDKCADLGKHPATQNGLSDATLDLSLIADIWSKRPDTSVSLRTGRVGVNGEVGGGDWWAMDVDNKPGKSGLDQLSQLEDIFGRLPDTVVAQTPSGGKHLLFGVPADLSLRIGNRRGLQLRGAVNQRFPHIDVRGEGGYIVAAPSFGRDLVRKYAYESGSSPRDLAPAQLPEAWYEAIVHRIGERPQNSVLPEGSWPELKARIKRAKQYLLKIDAAVAGQGGHDQAFIAAIKLVRGFVLPEDEAYELLLHVYNPICQPPWSEKEIWHKISQAVSSSRADWGFAFEKDAEREATFQAGQKKRVLDALAAQSIAEAQALARMRAAGQGALPDGAPVARHLPEAEVRADLNEAARAGGADVPPPIEMSPPPPSGPGGEPFHFTRGDETELSEALLSVLDTPERPFTFDEETFWRYAGDEVGVWEPISDATVENMAMDFARKGFIITDVLEEKRRTLKVSYNSAVGARKALRAALLSDPSRTRLRFEHAWRGIAFGNGFLRMGDDGTVTMIGHHRAHMCRYAFPFHYVPEAPHPRLDALLEALWSNVDNPLDRLGRAALLQEFIGGCLFGLSPSFQKALILSGVGQNGKSQVLDFARSCFPPGSVQAVAPQDWGKPFQLVPLIGARANFVDEVSENDVAHSNKVKSVVSGGLMTIDRKNKACVTATIDCGHMLNVNAMFSTIDFSLGFFRRFIILDFSRRFTEETPGFTREIGKRIAAEEQQGLVAWAIAGAMRLLRQNAYTVPASSSAALEQWKMDVDPVRRFVVEADEFVSKRLDPSSAGWKASEMYDHFVGYCKVNGFGIMSSTKFGTRLRSLQLLERLHTRRGDFWKFLPATWRDREASAAEALATEAQRLKRERLERAEEIVQDVPPDTSPPARSPRPYQAPLDLDELDALAPTSSGRRPTSPSSLYHREGSTPHREGL